uniref:Uncharacterized protein n=1 Tax=Pavo cristatus TaxID=9049 RepID=A0A8C9F7L9_PAVCR
MQSNYSETASFAALSGGTLSGGVLSGGKGKYSRLEVQADVQKEIFPKDSVSLGAISDNASTRAMAGSIISSYNPQDRECNNMEIQVDIEAKPSHYQLASGSSTEDSLHCSALTSQCSSAPTCISLSHSGRPLLGEGQGLSTQSSPSPGLLAALSHWHWAV